MAKMPEYNLEQQLEIAAKTLRAAARAFRQRPTDVATYAEVAEWLEASAGTMEEQGGA